VAETLKGAAESLPVVAETSAAAAENKTVAENGVRHGKWSEGRK